MCCNLDDRIDAAIDMAIKSKPKFDDRDVDWEKTRFKKMSRPDLYVIRFSGATVSYEMALANAIMDALVAHGIQGFWSGIDVDPIYVYASIPETSAPTRHGTSPAEKRQLNRLVKRAFKMLEKMKITCFHALLYSRDEGVEAIDQIISNRDRLRGYAFYSEEDLELLGKCGRLRLSYGTFCDGDATASDDIGCLVSNVLQKVGLDVIRGDDAEGAVRVELRRVE